NNGLSTVASNINITNDVAFNIGGTSTGPQLVLTGTVSSTGAKGLSKSNTGVVQIDGNATYSGNTTVSGGVLRFSKPFTSGASVNVTGGTLQMAHSDATPYQNVLKTAAVTVTGGNIDLVDNKMIVTGGAAASSWNGSAYGGTGGLVRAGYI